ncbi:hypothetical protein L2E82_22150 [Cichorium intybus]|uniref:Uncharacterized protein n=1 Tax=Cichorium intybus TaxID=13427 RepID=A0ACB9DWJ9_CICIN|nr:hypothetical protein L2E82_22150 [Cichorium intybus]
MEARQFKRFSEERMAHDQQEIMELEDCLYQREQTIQALTCESNEHHDAELDNESIDIEERIDQLERSPKHSLVREIYTVDSVHNVGSFENDQAKLGTYDDLNSARSESS